jgi:hypothetical protein
MSILSYPDRWGRSQESIESESKIMGLHQESLLITANGFVKPVKSFEVGDSIVNSEGFISKIQSLTDSGNSTQSMVKVHVRGMNIEPLHVSTNVECMVVRTKKCKYTSQVRICQADCKHPSNVIGACKSGDAPYHAYKTVWIKASELAIYDYIIYTPPKFKSVSGSIHIADFLEVDWFSVCEDNVWYQKNKNGKTVRGGVCKYFVKNEILIDDDFAYIAGLFVAEGSTPIRENRGTIYFSFSDKEYDFAQSVIRILYEKFGVKASKVRHMHPDKAIRVEIYSKPLAITFANLFGKGARNKKIPECIFNAEASVLKSFLRGLFHGDGCERFSTFATSSRNLLEQVRCVLAGLGYIMSVYYSKKIPTLVKIGTGKKNFAISGVAYYGQLPRGVFSEIYSGMSQSWADKVLRHGGLYGLAIKKVEQVHVADALYQFTLSSSDGVMTPSGVVRSFGI